LLFPCIASAQAGYEISMDLFVAIDGSVLVYGDTSLDGQLLDLGGDSFPLEDGRFSNKSDRLTGKDGENWTLSFTLPSGMSENSLITIYLPPGAKRKDDSGSYEIFPEGDDLVILFTGQSYTEIWVEYTLGQASPIDWEAYLVPVLLIAAAVMLVAGGARLIKPRFAPAEAPSAKRVLNEAKWDAIAPTLTERERMVLESIMKEGGRVSQRKLRHICDLPKSTLSRVTDELQRKGLLRKIPVGQTNEIRLDDRLLE
jgi:hypothetical protein